jgi:hypothetical protein
MMLIHTEHLRKMPDFGAQMLLHTKEHCESISPKEKAQILQNNAAAHKNQHESFSPKETAQIVTKTTRVSHSPRKSSSFKE